MDPYIHRCNDSSTLALVPTIVVLAEDPGHILDSYNDERGNALYPTSGSHFLVGRTRSAH
jgi:hypothetical protein